MADPPSLTFISDLDEKHTLWGRCIPCSRRAILSFDVFEPWDLLARIHERLICKKCRGRECTIAVTYQDGTANKTITVAHR